jgi:proton-dependent oligopeptide transporter, POT family
VPNPLPRSAIGWVAGIAVVVVAVIVVVFATGLVKLSNLSQVTTGVIILAAVAYFVVMLTSSKVSALERTRVRAFIPLFIANAVFWSLFQQIFTVLAVYSGAPTTPRKFAYGVIGMGLAFLLFLPMSGTTGKAVPALLVVGIMAVFAASELLLSPIGLFSDDKACA